MFLHFHDRNDDPFDIHHIPLSRQTVEMAESHAAYGGHSRVFDAEVRQVVEVREFHVARYQVHVFIAFPVELLPCDHVRGMPENEIQHVTQCDESLDATELVQHHRTARVLCLEKIEHLVDLLGGRRDDRRSPDIIECQLREILVVEYEAQHVLGVKESHQVVPVSPVDRDTGMTDLPKPGDHVGYRQVGIEKSGARARGHDLHDFGVTGLQQVVDQGAFRGIEFAALGDLFHEASELVHVEDVFRLAVLPDDQGGDPFRHATDQPSQRRDDAHPPAHGLGDRGTDPYRVRHRYGLGGDLAHQEKEWDHDEEVDPAGPLVAVERNQDASHIGGGSDVDQFVAGQDGDDQPPRLVEQFVQGFGVGATFLAQFLQVESRQRKQRSFRAGKKG